MTLSKKVHIDLKLFFDEWYMGNTELMVKHLNDTIFMLAFVESRLFSPEEVSEVCLVLKKLSLVLEGRVCE